MDLRLNTDNFDCHFVTFPSFFGLIILAKFIIYNSDIPIIPTHFDLRLGSLLEFCKKISSSSYVIIMFG